MRRQSRSRKRPAKTSTPSTSTAARGSGRPTSCRPSPTRSPKRSPPSTSSTRRARSSSTSMWTACITQRSTVGTGQRIALPQPLPQRRRAHHRRHPILGEQARRAGSVLPYLQRTLLAAQADRHFFRLPRKGADDARRAPSDALRRGAHRRHPAARSRNEDRHFKAQGTRKRSTSSPTTCSPSS